MLHLARYSSITPSDFERALGITVGFDSMFDRLFGDIQRSEAPSSFPPYNIRKDEEDKYTIEMAVAGFSQDDLEVELKEGVLTIRSKTDKDEKDYLHRGIARRAFSRSFTLSDDMIVKGADLVNGMLTIDLEKIVPEEKKSRLIEIGQTVESKVKKLN
ncbi:MAG: Small heat shock protein IbpA [Deltaproteobacteria bacterium]|jgi:molecular chaperone IbpA|nr:Small heat shock protein IbpA [Deltaproteobacteria bacterium]